MKKDRVSFLADILSLELSETHQLMIANEYNSANDKPLVYINDEYGLQELCEGKNIAEILRASYYGGYNPTDPYVFFNAHGNLETTDEVSNDWKTIAEWMIDGGYKNSFNAWDILNNVSYVETGDFENDFLDEFPYHFEIDEEKAREWFEYADYTLSYLLLISWHDLKENYDNWLEER